MSIRGCFSAQLFQYRTKNGLIQRQVAERCNLSLRHYQELEIGRLMPSLSTAVRMAAVLDLSLDILKDEVDPDAIPLSED